MSENTDLTILHVELSVAYDAFRQVVECIVPEGGERADVYGYWSAKNVVAHLIGWDESFQLFIKNPETFNPEPLYDTDAFNAESVNVRQHLSWQETIDEMQCSFLGLEDSIKRVSPKMLMYKRVCEWTRGRVQDYNFHADQLRGDGVDL